MGRADFEWLKRNCERQILWFDAMSWRWRMWLWWRLCRLPASASGSDSDSAPSAPFHFHLGRPAQCHCHSALPAFDSRFANMSKPLRQSCVLSVLRAPNPHSTTSSVFSECSSCAHFSFQFLQIFPLVRVFCVLDRFVMHVLFLKNGCRVTSIVFLSVCPSFSSSASRFRLFCHKDLCVAIYTGTKKEKKIQKWRKNVCPTLRLSGSPFCGHCGGVETDSNTEEGLLPTHFFSCLFRGLYKSSGCVSRESFFTGYYLFIGVLNYESGLKYSFLSRCIDIDKTE